MTDWNLDQLVAAFRRASPAPASSVERLREQLEATTPGTPPDGVSVTTIEVAGVSCDDIVPDSISPGAILYLHGGGFVAGSPRTHRHLTGALAKAAGLRMLVPDYRLAPEHPFPAALEDALIVFDHLSRLQGGTHRVGIVGDSAGGGLAVELCRRLVAAGERPARLAVISPWLVLDRSDARDPLLELADPLIRSDDLQWLGELFDPRSNADCFAPLNHSLDDFPPTLIQVGSDEVLLPDSRRLAEMLRHSGVPVDLEIEDGLFHVWHAFVPRLPHAREAVARLAHFVASRTADARERA